MIKHRFEFVFIGFVSVRKTFQRAPFVSCNNRLKKSIIGFRRNVYLAIIRPSSKPNVVNRCHEQGDRHEFDNRQSEDEYSTLEFLRLDDRIFRVIQIISKQCYNRNNQKQFELLFIQTTQDSV